MSAVAGYQRGKEVIEERNKVRSDGWRQSAVEMSAERDRRGM